MEKESVSSVKPKRGRKGRPPKSSAKLSSVGVEIQRSPAPEPMDYGKSNTVPDQSASSLNTDAAERVKQLQEDEDKKIMPPPPSATPTPPMLNDPKQDELMVDGFSVLSYGTETELQAALKKHTNVYQNRRLSIDKLVKPGRKSPAEPKTPGRRGKAPVKIGKENRSIKSSIPASNGTASSLSTDSESNATDRVKDESDDSKPIAPKIESGLLSENGVKNECTTPDIKPKTPASPLPSVSSTTVSQCKSFLENCQSGSELTTHHHQYHHEALNHRGDTKVEEDSTPRRASPNSHYNRERRHSQTNSSSSTPQTQVSREGKKHSERTSATTSGQPVSRGSSEDTSRCSSTRSISSTSGSRPTPPAGQSTTSQQQPREQDTASRTSSRNSDRTLQGTTSLPQTSPSATEYSNLYPSPYNLPPQNMLSMNGFPLNPAAAAGLLGSPPGMPPFGQDLMSQYHHAAAINDAMMQRQAELNRRLLMEGAMNSPTPYMRPDLLMPHLSSANMASSPMAPPSMSSLPGTNPHLKSSSYGSRPFEKEPHDNPKFGLDKMMKDPMSFYQRGSAPAHSGFGAAVAPTSLTTPAGSLFQSVNSSSSAGLNSSGCSSTTPKKSGKWCAAHVRVAWQIHEMQMKTRGESRREKNGETGLNSERKLTPSPGLHPFNSTTILPKPQEVTPSTSSSASVFTPLCVDRCSTTASSSTPGSYSSHSGSQPLPRPAGGAPVSLSVPSLTSPSSEWNKLQGIPSSSTAHNSWPRGSKSEHGREKIERDTHRRSTEMRSRTPERPRHADLSSRHRSRSRSPHQPSYAQLSSEKPKINSAVKPEPNGLDVARTSEMLQQAMLASEIQRQQVLNGMFSGLAGDNKLPPGLGAPGMGGTPGLGPPPPGLTDLPGMWNAFRGGLPNPLSDFQQREMERDRERNMLMHMNLNPSMALLAEKSRQQIQNEMKNVSQRQRYMEQGLFDMDRAKAAAAASLRSGPGAAANGLHPLHAALNSLNAGGPPPLIPTSQAKLTSPASHSKHNGTSSGASNSTGSENETHSR